MTKSVTTTVGLAAALIICSGPAATAAPQNTPAATTNTAQTPGAQASSPPDEPQHRGGFVPGQKRKPEDPAQVARGKLLFGINCRGCHGADLRGGDLGGPNLLRSQVALSDLHGELIMPIIHGSRQSMGMPAIRLSDADAAAVAAYVRSVIESIQVQGAPPTEKEPPSILVGNAADGKSYFTAKCATCHSVTGDLSNIAKRIPDMKKLQDAWLAGGTEEEFEHGPAGNGQRTVTATVTLPSGETVQGKLLRVDDFLITVALADGSQRSFRRDGNKPTVAIHDPLKTHREMLPQYRDEDIHNVTAYLAGVK